MFITQVSLTHAWTYIIRNLSCLQKSPPVFLRAASQVLSALLLCTVLLVDVCCFWNHLGYASP